MDLFENLGDGGGAGDNTPEFTVSEIAGTVRRILEGEMPHVRVRGEVGRVVHARSGHLYFDLKDDKSVLSCMTWKGQVAGLELMPEEGMEVIAEGKMTASGFSSKYGLNVTRVAVAGEGALMAMLERRKKALAAEGLFAAERKKPLPFLPEIIGVVTSPQGAVIRDILHRLRDRFPRKVLIWPVAVQGKECAPQVAAAIRGFNALTPGGAMPRPDLIIVARGGGSIEDLWGFNEEVVARAAAESAIPLISAVGHETDTTLIDFVADRRAPTPTAAAEMAVPVRVELIAWTREQEARLLRCVQQAVERRRQRLSDLSRILPRPETLLSDPRQRLDRAEARLGAALERSAARKRKDFEALAGALRPAALRARVADARRRLDERGGRLAPALARDVALHRERLGKVRLRAEPLILRLGREREALLRAGAALDRCEAQGRTRRQDRLDALGRMLETLSYQATLARGYAVVRDAGGEVVTDAVAARAEASLEIEFRDGRVPVRRG